MKTACAILALLAGLTFRLPAQTGGITNFSDIHIFSDQAEFDLESNVAIYRGNVRVEEARMKLTCDLLTAKLPQRGGRIESIVAEQNVKFDLTDEKGQTVHGRGDKAVYTYQVSESGTNEVMELMGNPVLETVQGDLTGDVITYDRTTGRFRATNQRTVVRADQTGDTNALPLLKPQPAPSETTNTPASQ